MGLKQFVRQLQDEPVTLASMHSITGLCVELLSLTLLSGHIDVLCPPIISNGNALHFNLNSYSNTGHLFV